MTTYKVELFAAFFIISLTPCNAAMEFKGMDLTKHHPSRVLSLLIGNCRKHEATCPMSIESTAQFLLNINELMLSFEHKYEHQLLALIESLSIDLRHCKDVMCVIEFEKSKGRLFEVAVQKAGVILKSLPAVEKVALEQNILQPPPFF